MKTEKEQLTKEINLTYFLKYALNKKYYFFQNKHVPNKINYLKKEIFFLDYLYFFILFKNNNFSM